jgi:site-specific recombinase XerD
METLKEFKEWQDRHKELCGGSWVDTDRLFTRWNGIPMSPRTPEVFLKKLAERTGIRRVTIHSFRHFNASVLINSGVDVVTVQTALGHSTAATTLSIYSHAFSSTQTRAMEAVANAIDL